jgi:dTDP-4-dehydrorhamnose reductase
MLGSEAVIRLRASGHEILVPDRSTLDLADPRSLERFFQIQTFDGLVNCAAFTAVDACEDPSQYPLAWRINGEAPGEMARLSRASGRWMIQVSTDYVFDGTLDRPYQEGDPVNPVNAYGRTKLEGERLFQEAGSPGWIVRTSWLYGPRGRNFVKTIAGLLGTREKLEVVDDQTGGPTATADLADFFQSLLQTGAPHGIYHFAGSGFTTWYGFAEAIREELKITACELVPVPSGKFPRPARRPKNSRFDLRKAEAVSRGPSRPWREALREYLREEGL